MWVKYFADGSTIKEPASWSRTRLDGMIATELTYMGASVKLSGAGDYWQSDDFLSVRNNPEPQLLKRRIEKRLDNGQWEIAEIDTVTGKISRYISPKRI